MKAPMFAEMAALAAVAGFSGLAVAAEPKVVALDFAKPARTSSTARRDLQRRDPLNRPTTFTGNPPFLNISIGTPAQPVAVYIDSGSSDLWLPASGGNTDFCASTQYGCGDLGTFSPSKSTSFNELQNMGTFGIEYGDGTEILGEYFTDTVAIGEATLKNVTMAVALRGKTVYPISGIMGVGYIVNESPTQSEKQSQKLNPYPNIISQMKNQGIINTLAYSLYMNDVNSGMGNILFGGVDKGKYTGDLAVVPVQPDPAYEQYYSSAGGGDNGPLSSSSDSSGAPNPVYDAFYVALTGVSYGSTKYDLGMKSATVLLDSGTSLIYLPDAVAEAVYKQFGAGVDEQYGPLVPCNATGDDAFEFTFGSGGPVIKVPLSQVVREFTPETLQGSDPPMFRDGSPACSFGITGAGDSETSSSGGSSGGGGGSGQQQQATFILGDTFLSSAYVVFDMTNNQIGLAQSNFNSTSSNIVEIASTIPGDSTLTGSSFSVASTPMTSAVHLTTHKATATDIGAIQTLDVTANTRPASATRSAAASTMGGASSMGGAASSSRSATAAVAGGSSTGTTASPSVSSFTNGAVGLKSPASSMNLPCLVAAGVVAVLGLTSGGTLLSWL